MKKFVPEKIDMPPRKMLVVISVGDPSDAGGESFEALFGTAYQTKFKTFKPRGIRMELGKLTALWPDAHLKPRNEWTGIWAIPVPDYVEETDLVQKNPERPVRLEIWNGGEFAQILHIGPYSEEAPTIVKLHAFIEGELGVPMEDVPGTHEEEYLTSPDAKLQKTVIRYRVR